MIEERVNVLMKRLEGFHQNQTVVRLDDAFSALTADIIASYCFGKSWRFVEAANFRSDFRAAVSDVANFVHIGQLCPWLIGLLRMLPLQQLRKLQPGKAAVFEIFSEVSDQADRSLKSNDQQRFIPDVQGQQIQETIFAKLTSPDVQSEERTLRRLQEEGLVVLGAGTETTAGTLTVAAFYLAWNKEIARKLRAELEQLLPSPTSTTSVLQLEKLPYLVRPSSPSLNILTHLVTLKNTPDARQRLYTKASVYHTVR
ncbi:Cytochrome P450 [Aspergillus sclerotialis]|uniref:Cytochrome P450 n=1 Tax=Aspergillus sclerotialis TaxID=2070753 RepID=A0A3A2ZP27_9EURO|nr:Cytochrome P450 [Aspergillus sclerotialis]